MYDRLKDLEGGRVILLNFLHGLKVGHFKESDALRALLRRWRRDLTERSALLTSIRIEDFTSCLHTAYMKVLGNDALSDMSFILPQAQLGRLVRVIDVYSLVLSEEWGLLNRTLLLRDPTVLLSGWEDNPNHHRLIEQLNGRTDAIRMVTDPMGSVGPVVVRGQLPFGWATGLALLKERISHGSAADEARDALGLSLGVGIHLYELAYPHPDLKSTVAKRPTFAEANANPYFRARRDTSGDDYGRTADLKKATLEATDIEGLPEILVGAEPMSIAFEWRYAGRISTATPQPRQAFFERSLVDTDEIDAACYEACSILDRLSS